MCVFCCVFFLICKRTNATCETEFCALLAVSRPEFLEIAWLFPGSGRQPRLLLRAHRQELVNWAVTLTSRILTRNFPRFGNLNCQFLVSNNVINCGPARPPARPACSCYGSWCMYSTTEDLHNCRRLLLPSSSPSSNLIRSLVRIKNLDR